MEKEQVYIVTRVMKAIAMTHKEFKAHMKQDGPSTDDAGYCITEGGPSISWIPKVEFEAYARQLTEAEVARAAGKKKAPGKQTETPDQPAAVAPVAEAPKEPLKYEAKKLTIFKASINNFMGSVKDEDSLIKKMITNGSSRYKKEELEDMAKSCDKSIKLCEEALKQIDAGTFGTKDGGLIPEEELLKDITHKLTK